MSATKKKRKRNAMESDATQGDTRRRVVLGAVVVALALAGGAGAAGCIDESGDCARTRTCNAGAGTGGAGGGGNPVCSADPREEPGAVIEECGVFVSASAMPGGDGTRARPLQSLGEAAASGARRVYACAEEYAEAAGVSFSGGVEIYAGFADCGGEWTWAESAKGKLLGPADAVALTLGGGENRIVSLDVVAGDAVAMGGSSIGVVIEGGSLAMADGSVTAGNGRDGGDGESLEADAALNGAPGVNGKDACMGDVIQGNPGGEAATKMCGGETTVGGKGGDGGKVQPSPLLALAGGDGDAGMPDGLGGQKGLGEPEMGAWGCFPGAGSPGGGAPGDTGGPATGAGESALGTLSASGFVGAAGDAGIPGKPGQGGGGGGGAKGGQICAGNTFGAGASGGSGGSGGCGGVGGGGGKGGGASLAVVSLGAEVAFTNVTVTAGNAGLGGKGGVGQPGGTGGTASQGGQAAGGSNPACDGGKGGKGGNGGSGGGGRGGHSIAIAYTGAMPAGATIAGIGTARDGGDGGPGNEAAGKGASGVAAEMLAFE